jgi:hypothetical protein
MRKVCSVIFHIIAGFFFYLVSVLAFISGLPALGKAGLLAGFSVPALIALVIGLALTGFRNWKRDTGVVLLSTSAFNAFILLTMICLFMSEEARRLMPLDALANFGAYVIGGVVIAVFASLGWMLVRTDTGGVTR